MKRKRFVLMMSVLWIYLFAETSILEAQEDTCPTLVETALITVGDSCSDVGRNEICYGHGNIRALNFENAPLAGFDTFGDIIDIENVLSLSTAPMDVDNDIWGIALMSVQADLPDSLPGQNVTFLLFGDTEIVNEVQPGVELDVLPTLTASSNDNINVRTGPSTNYTIVGTLSRDETITLLGRNQTGDWVRIDADVETWVYAPLLTINGDINTLDILEIGEQADISFSAPMQAFHFTTGIGQTKCEQAPRDGLLIQAPTDTQVTFLINGVSVTIGSTALVRMKDTDKRLQIANLAGTITVESGEERVELEIAQQVDVIPGSNPGEAEVYNYEDVRGLPVDLLPEGIAVLPGRNYRLAMCGFAENGESVGVAGEPIAVGLAWLETLENTTQMSQATLTLTYDGMPIPLWNLIPPRVVNPDNPAESHRIDWWWTIPAPQPGEHVMELSGDAFLDVTLTCSLTIP